MDNKIQQLKATIRSCEPVTLENVQSITDAITYTKVAEVKFGEYYYTELLITVDLEEAEADLTEDFSIEKTWTGNIWDWLEDGPFSRMNEDNVLPESCDFSEDVEINGMSHWEWCEKYL